MLSTTSKLDNTSIECACCVRNRWSTVAPPVTTDKRHWSSKVALNATIVSKSPNSNEPTRCALFEIPLRSRSIVSSGRSSSTINCSGITTIRTTRTSHPMPMIRRIRAANKKHRPRPTDIIASRHETGSIVNWKNSILCGCSINYFSTTSIIWPPWRTCGRNDVNPHRSITKKRHKSKRSTRTDKAITNRPPCPNWTINVFNRLAVMSRCSSTVSTTWNTAQINRDI